MLKIISGQTLAIMSEMMHAGLIVSMLPWQDEIWKGNMLKGQLRMSRNGY